MNKEIIFLAVICISIINCSRNVESINNDLKEKKKIELKIDLENEKILQNEVDEGHQPWRLEPIDVAYAALSTIDKQIHYENCHLINEKINEAEVNCRNTKNYFVYLKKLVRPNGIWTAILVEME
jgi:hypothetical protein